MPNRKQYLAAYDGTGNDAVKLIVGPALPNKKSRRDDDYTQILASPWSIFLRKLSPIWSSNSSYDSSDRLREER